MKTVIESKNGDYRAELADTPDGVSVVIWKNDIRVRSRVAVYTLDAPFGYVADRVHDTIWNCVVDRKPRR